MLEVTKSLRRTDDGDVLALLDRRYYRTIETGTTENSYLASLANVAGPASAMQFVSRARECISMTNMFVHTALLFRPIQNVFRKCIFYALHKCMAVNVISHTNDIPNQNTPIKILAIFSYNNYSLQSHPLVLGADSYRLVIVE